MSNLERKKVQTCISMVLRLKYTLRSMFRSDGQDSSMGEEEGETLGNKNSPEKRVNRAS